MLRFRSCLALLLAAALTACAASRSPENASVQLYYQQAETSYASPDGVLAAAYMALPEDVTYSEFLNLYFSQPVEPSLRSPFPKGLRCDWTYLEGGVLTVYLSEEYDALSGLDRSLAAACLTLTLTQFRSVHGVCLETEKSAASGAEPALLREQDFVRQDLGAVNTETAVRLYFSDANGRYLVSTERKNYFQDPAQIPSYVVQQLIDGPAEEGQLAVMPEGTVMRSLTLDEDGICTVDLSSEFYLNRPNTELLERMTVLALVNSLTELSQVQSVRILVEGQAVGLYRQMDLDRELVRDESAIAVVRAGRNETDATIYVRGCDGVRLAAVPVCIRETAQQSLPEALLAALTGFRGVNGLENPVPEGTWVQQVEQESGVCRVDMSAQFLDCAGDETRELMAIRAVTATLASLDEVTFVKISVNGQHTGFQYYSLDHLYRPSASWFSS